MNPIRTQSLGYPRIGKKRELKKATEAYWRGEGTRDSLESTARDLRRKHWQTQRDAGIDLIPSNDFSLYDQVLDLTCLLGNIPRRYAWDGTSVDLDLYFRLARGGDGGDGGDGGGGGGGCCSADTTACELTKWFDTNYHYLVPEFDEDSTFSISTTKVFDEFSEALAQGIRTKPVLIGPLTYLTLGKETRAAAGFSRFDLAEDLIRTYVEILTRLAGLGATSIQIDEPAFALDLTERQRQIARQAFTRFRRSLPDVELQVTSYFGELRDNLGDFLALPVDVYHVDAVRASAELPAILQALEHREQSLSIGVVDGRNIWKNDLKKSHEILKKAAAKIDPGRLIIAPSCSLLHVPVTLDSETSMDPEIRDWLSFAEQKLIELETLRRAMLDPSVVRELFTANAASIQARALSDRVRNPEVRARAATLREGMFTRHSPYHERRKAQRDHLDLPPFPTTTIGSFPQTTSIREARAKHRNGEWNRSQYDTFLKLQTLDCIKVQEAAGLDVLVHGEFERNDMVEYFGERLEGFIFSRFGWVQSYGTRCVKPPIIFGDVSRPEPMTVDWAKFAGAQTNRPMKGMLTGPVTILQWSFVRDDQPRKQTAFQIALAIRDEVVDLEAAGLPIIQIDEAAIREGLPLRRTDWEDYFDWSVDAFRLSAAGVSDKTQIHTHMCYSEFGDMLDAITRLDADVITIENARSNSELIDSFTTRDYPNEIGPGVYDIHSPRVPSVDEIEQLITELTKAFPAEQIWVNPDCGLKTRSWDDVRPALSNMVEATKRIRATQKASA